MSDHIITELREEINRDRFNNFFKNNAKLLIALAVIAFISLATYEAYKFYDVKARMNSGDMLYEVASDAKNPNNAKKLEEIVKNSSYKEIALLNEAGYHSRLSNNDAAKKSYTELAAIKNANPAFSELARLNLVAMKINESPNDVTVEAELKELSADNAVYKFTALEMLGSYYKKQGKAAEAKAIFKKIADDEKAPESISGRAKALQNSF